MKASIDALTAKIWTVGGKKNVSLLEVGYHTAGIDEGWEACGKGFLNLSTFRIALPRP